MSQLLSFGRSLVQTARTWVDEASLVMSGYRDRVVTVYQGEDEGGLNLSMPAEVVDRLSMRGRKVNVVRALSVPIRVVRDRNHCRICVEAVA
jgi:hypothetical protein